MSRVAPTPRSKVLYFFCIALSSFLLYLDINYKSFESTKNLYKSFTISSSYLLKRLTIDPLNYIFEISKEKSKLIEENKKLKKELDNSFIANFIISRDSKFFADDSAIKRFINLNNINKPFHLAKMNSFDLEKYLCCSEHRMFIKIFSQKPQKYNLIAFGLFSISEKTIWPFKHSSIEETNRNLRISNSLISLST